MTVDETSPRMLPKHRVLLTRSEPGASRQARALAAYGLQPVKMPLIRIEPVAFALGDSMPDMVIVLSAHAVRHGARAITRWGQAADWFAVGEATARALRCHGIQAVCPERASSEGLLELAALRSPANRSVAILCGRSPRPLLERVLIARGAQVSEYQVYERLPVDGGSGYHAQLKATEVHAVVVSSVAGVCAFSRLWKVCGGSPAVMLCVNSTRAAEAAAGLGFTNLRILESQSDTALGRALLDWVCSDQVHPWT